MPAACPSCGAKYGDGFEQNYGEARHTVISYVDPKTVGQQADLNAKKMGAAAYQEAHDRHYPKKERPWYRDDDGPLDLDKIKDVKRFIETGEKD